MGMGGADYISVRLVMEFYVADIIAPAGQEPGILKPLYRLPHGKLAHTRTLPLEVP